MAPGPSLAGVRLLIAEHASGLPVLRALPLCTCCRHYPGAAAGCIVCSLSQPCQPSPIWQSGRPAHCPFRGLLGVHLRYGLHTRAATVFRGTLHRRLQPFRYLHSCSGCFRLEPSPGGAFTHWESAAFHGARQVRTYRNSRWLPDSGHSPTNVKRLGCGAQAPAAEHFIDHGPLQRVVMWHGPRHSIPRSAKR